MSTQNNTYNLTSLNSAEHFGATNWNDFPDLLPLPNRSGIIKKICQGKTAVIGVHENDKEEDLPKSCDIYRDKTWSTPTKNLIDCTYDGLNKTNKILEKYDTIILEHSLEYLDDIRPLLCLVRQLLIGKNIKVQIIPIQPSSTVYGYRNWTDDEYKVLLESFGLDVEIKKYSDCTYFTVSCTKESYEQFLQSKRLPKSDIELLLITTEHSGYRVTGGIGSYINECDHLYGNDAGILIIDNNRDLDTETLHTGGWFAAQTFLSAERFDTVSNSNFDTIADVVNEAIEALLPLYPNLKYIEAQEMLLYRAIESKRCGFIPADIKLITVCHGSSFHLAKAKRDVIELENIHVAYREKFTLEYSDYVVFPTEFLKNSYIDSGIIGLDKPTRFTRRLPFDYARLPEGRTLSSYKRLIYVGKTSTVKGFDLFLGTLLKLKETNNNVLQDIEEVCIFATSIEIKEAYLKVMYEEVLRHYNVKILSLPRQELLKTLSDYSEDSLVLVTYKGDNHSMAVLEFMGVGIDFLAARAGGTPELIANKFKNDFLVDPEPHAFADATLKVLGNVSGRSKKIANLHVSYRKEQEKINNGYSLDFYKDLPNLNDTALGGSSQSDVYIQLERNPGGDKQQTITSLNNQTKKILESKKDTSYTLRLYEGDVLHPRAVEWMSSILDVFQDIDVVFGYEDVWVYDGEKSLGQQYLTPYPPQLGSVFLQEKYGRRYCAMFREGIDNDFTDWQKAILASSKGGKCAVIPRLLFRLGELEGYDKPDVLDNFSKMSHALSLLPVFDAYIINYQLKRLDDIYFGSKLFNHLEDVYVRRDDPRVMVGVTQQIKTLVTVYRKVPKPVRKIGFYAYRGMRKVYRKLRSFA